MSCTAERLGFTEFPQEILEADFCCVAKPTPTCLPASGQAHHQLDRQQEHRHQAKQKAKRCSTCMMLANHYEIVIRSACRRATSAHKVTILFTNGRVIPDPSADCSRWPCLCTELLLQTLVMVKSLIHGPRLYMVRMEGLYPKNSLQHAIIRAAPPQSIKMPSSTKLCSARALMTLRKPSLSEGWQARKTRV